MDAASVNVGDPVTLYPQTAGGEGDTARASPLWGVVGRVVHLEAWGAYVRFDRGGRPGMVRLGWGEMTAPAANGHAPLKFTEPPLNMAEGLVAESDADDCRPAPRTRPSGMPTGDLCCVCGSANMTRDGTCMLCLDCGDKTGGCG